MNKSIKELKQHHIEIMKTFDAVRNCDIGTEQGLKILIEAQNLFKKHIKMEKQFFLANISDIIDSDHESQESFLKFKDDTETINRYTLKFFKKYTSSTKQNIEQFGNNFKVLYSIFKARIAEEETFFNKHFLKKG